MKYYTTLLWIGFILVVVSLIIGVVAKVVPDFRVFGLTPLSYLRFTGVCLLGVIALNLTELSLKLPKKED